MLRQYGAQRHRVELRGGRASAVGVVPLGAIRRITVGMLDTVIVEAWLPREIAGAAPDRRGYFTQPRYVARGGHLAIVRSLRTGRRYQLSDAWLRDPEDD